MDQIEYPIELPDYNNNSRGLFTGSGIQGPPSQIVHLVSDREADHGPWIPSYRIFYIKKTFKRNKTEFILFKNSWKWNTCQKSTIYFKRWIKDNRYCLDKRNDSKFPTLKFDKVTWLKIRFFATVTKVVFPAWDNTLKFPKTLHLIWKESVFFKVGECDGFCLSTTSDFYGCNVPTQPRSISSSIQFWKFSQSLTDDKIESAPILFLSKNCPFRINSICQVNAQLETFIAAACSDGHVRLIRIGSRCSGDIQIDLNNFILLESP